MADGSIPFLDGPKDGDTYAEERIPPSLIRLPGGRYALTGDCREEPVVLSYVWHPYYDAAGEPIDFPLPPGFSEEDLI